jgi:hypothetical protein
MSDNPPKLSVPLLVPLLKEANYPAWHPAMEARLHQFDVFRIVTGKTQEPSPPALILHMQDANSQDKPLLQAALIHNSQMTLEYQKRLNAYREREEKAASNILAHLSRSQQMHTKDKGSDAKGIWDALKFVHVQPVPGMRFSAYNELFSVAKGANETLPAVTPRVEDALARVKELCPAKVKLAIGTRPYRLDNLDNELALMAKLSTLLRKEYGDLTSCLMRQKDLTHANVEVVLQVEQTKHNAHRSPLLSLSGDHALHANAAGLPRQNKPGVKRGFCTGEGHNKDACFKKDCARKDAQKAVKERRANCNSAKPCYANSAAASSSPALSNSAKVMELTTSTSVCLAGSPDMHTDAYWIADTGATSYMSPRCSWFTKLGLLAIPIRVANDHVVYGEGVGLVLVEPADKSLHPVLLSRVLYVLSLQNNLLSVLHLVTHHCYRIEIHAQRRPPLHRRHSGYTAWLNTSAPPAPEAALYELRTLAPSPLPHWC